MNIFNDIIKENSSGKLQISPWVEWRHINLGFMHCKTCLALDRCWFLKTKMPEIPQHQNCHCQAYSIPTPNKSSINSYCPIEKFVNYIFSINYIVNGKFKLFEKWGFKKEDSKYLKEEYERQAKEKFCSGDYQLGTLNEFGQRITIEITLIKDGRKIVIKSGWMIYPNGLIQLTTPYAG